MAEAETRSLSVEQLEGQTLDGRFFMQRLLGAGNFGAVYFAEQRVFDLKFRAVALKLFHGEIVTQANAADVLNDAIILMQLQQEPAHAEVARHLVTVLDAGFLHEKPEQAFVAMEYVDGYPTPGGGTIRTLQGLLRAFHPVPVDLALRWMLQILAPLAWMHTLPRPVLHCDLKPDNILVCGKDTLKVADFGLARLACGVVGAGGAGGALICQAPETLLGINPTPASDVYALGLMLYEILAGKNPLTEIGLEASAAKRHERYRQLQIQAREAGLPPLPDYDHPDRPAGEQLTDHPVLLELIERCLRFKATERYDNAGILLQALERYASGQGVVVLPAQETQSVKPEVPAPALTLERLLTEARVCLRRGRLDEARVRCDQAQRRFQQSGKPYRWLAEIQLVQGQWKDALQTCAQGIKVDPNEPELLETIAHAYDMGGQGTAAAEMRKRAMVLRQRARK